MTLPECNQLAELLRTYIAAFGAKAALLIIAVILEENAKAAPGKPHAVTADINAGVLRQAMGRMVG